MEKSCAINGCDSESFDGCGISFFQLPDDKAIKRQWLERIGSSVSNNSVICSRHFNPEDIIIHSNSTENLKPSAVPVIFPMCSEIATVQECPPLSNIFKDNDDLNSMLITIIENCRSEAKYNTVYIPLEEYESRASYYTGLPIEHIQEISKEIQCSVIETDKISLNLSERILIHQTLQSFYAQGETPTFKNVHEVLINRFPNFPNLSDFIRQMKVMGFNYRKLVNGKGLLMEDPKITFERCLYLNKIKKIRSFTSQIYYIDERYIDKGLNFKKPWVQNINKNLIETEDLFLFFHILSHNCDNYVVSGMFTNQGSESDFQKWIVDDLVHNLKPNSTIIMDKSPLHGVLNNKTISRYHSKEDMLIWLKENDIPCNVNMDRAQLYELIRKCPLTDEEFTIDCILRAHGHNVLRLPTHFHDLSPIEFMWEYISSSDFSHSEHEWNDIQFKIMRYIKEIPNSKWIDFVETTKKIEENLRNINAEIENSLDNYKFSLQ